MLHARRILGALNGAPINARPSRLWRARHSFPPKAAFSMTKMMLE